MNDKRDEIRKVIAIELCSMDNDYWESLPDETTNFTNAFHSKTFYLNRAKSLMKHLNPLVVIPDTEGELPKCEVYGKSWSGDSEIPPPHIKQWNDIVERVNRHAHNIQLEMKQAGYVLGIKLVEATNET